MQMRHTATVAVVIDASESLLLLHAHADTLTSR
jgi:hypothetical protein